MVAIVPTSLLVPKLINVNEDMDPRVEGMLPVSELAVKAKLTSFVNEPVHV